MLIADEVKKERQLIIGYTKDWAARWTEEYWRIRECASSAELQSLARENAAADMICVDITMKGALESVKLLRRADPGAYVILIASADISPVKYMRPSIGAESLILKPLIKEEVEATLSEALQTYLQRFLKPDEKKVFIVESRGERTLVDYERILFFEAREKRVFLNTGAAEYGFYDTLDQLEGRLPEAFIRCHRSYLVNKSKIEQVYLSQNRLVLKEAFEIPLSRTYKQRIKEYMAGGEWKWQR